MSNCNNSQVCGWPNELSGVMATATVVPIGMLLFNPVQLIFDNQSTAPVAISVNDPTGTNVWKTFTAGEAIVLDMRGNHGIAANFTASLGTTFYGAGTTGAGDFKISYTFAASNN
jgi:hypothetical protein